MVVTEPHVNNKPTHTNVASATPHHHPKPNTMKPTAINVAVLWVVFVLVDCTSMWCIWRQWMCSTGVPIWDISSSRWHKNAAAARFCWRSIYAHQHNPPTAIIHCGPDKMVPHDAWQKSHTTNMADDVLSAYVVRCIFCRLEDIGGRTKGRIMDPKEQCLFTVSFRLDR